MSLQAAWKGDDIDAVFLQIMKDRERAASRRIEI